MSQTGRSRIYKGMTRIHGMTPRGRARVPRSPLLEGRFGRMFRRLPAAPAYTVEQLTALAEQLREQEGGPAASARALG